MIVWWITEAVPIPVTALLPMFIFPLTGVFTINESTAPYSSHIIYLFMGGFIIALAMEKHNLHKRIALNLIKLTGTKANGIILGFMISTAFLSMWISNTATAVMMLPIALSVTELLSGKPATSDQQKPFKLFALALFLSIAYAANIGGTATIIGTPPNVVLSGIISQQYGIDLDFNKWLIIGIPTATILLACTYLLLTRVLFKSNLGRISGASDLIKEQLKELGPFSKSEVLVTLVFGLTASGWILKNEINSWIGEKLLTDTITAMVGGCLMFVVPVDIKKGEFLLDWATMKKLPWGILILFGGGLCLAKGMESANIIQLIGDSIANNGQFSVWILILVLTGVMLFMTELMSNVALTNIFVPVVAGIADGLNLSPLLLTIPVTMAASCAFMMPISTPPNAIVFASGYIRMKDMIRAGFLLNIISILLLLGAAVTLVNWVYLS